MTTQDATQLSRRNFLVSTAAVAGGFALGFHLPGRGAEAAPMPIARMGEAGAARGTEINAWIVIGRDGTVTIRIAKSEMGQGVLTSLPQMVAEELEADWSMVRSEFATVEEHLKRNRVFVGFGTGGSRSVRSSHDFLRKAGATARDMLIAAAAQKWGVPASECKAEIGRVVHVPTFRKFTYGELAEAAATLEPPKEVKLKDPKTWRIAGQPMKRWDTALKVDGRAAFGVDVQQPNLLHAAIATCPVFRGKVKSYDAAKVIGMRGVKRVVEVGNNGLAVVAEGSWWYAKKALDALPIEWDEGEFGTVSSASIREFMLAGLTADNLAVARKDGDVEAAFRNAARVVEAEYAAPYLNHATMEPMNCTARVTADGVEVWAPSQNAEATLAAAAAAASVSPDKVKVHIPLLGGGFGRRGFQDYTTQAVTIARVLAGTDLAGRPVKLMWSREEDMQHGFYRPAHTSVFRVALDAQGMPTAWHNRISGHSILAQVRPGDIQNGVDRHYLEGLHTIPYEISNQLVELAIRNSHVPVGFWRAVNSTQNAFVRESFIDEVAVAGGIDPVELRRKLLQNHPIELAVLNAAAAKSEWTKAPPVGRARGIALHESYGSFAAQVAEVSVGDDGKVRVHKVVCAIDTGHVINPDTIEAQIQGSVVYGLTAALYGEITIKNGRVEQGNFDDYQMLRIDEMPVVEVHLVPSGKFWGGAGEPGVPPLAPAVCNAIFALTGKRVRSLPLRNLDLRKA